MFRSLERKLILIYTMSTGLVLLTVIFVLLLYAEKALLLTRSDLFKNQVNNVENKLKFENSIQDQWLSQLEQKYQLLIYIEDNGNALAFPGVFKAPTDRAQLFDKLLQLAKDNNIDISKNPVSAYEISSDIYQFTGPKRDMYFGSIIIIPLNSGWRSLSVIQYLPRYHEEIFSQRLKFILLGLGGLLALLLINVILVKYILKPVKENAKRQTRFIASASHELRSPLAVINANSSAISPSSAEEQRFISGISKECRRMARLIEDMLLLASVDAKSWPVKKEPVETDTLLLDTYEIFQPLCQQKDNPLKLEIPEEELPAIMGDKDRLLQILSILLDNALSYSPKYKSILLRGYHNNNFLFLEVEDHGVGISDKDKKLIFERFYRADPSRKEKQHFGLGLSIARELVQLMEGRISVRDTFGGGTTFILKFKIHNPADHVGRYT